MEKLESLRYFNSVFAIRLVQGWIFLAAGIRRFFSNPGKLDPDSAQYMAHKLNHAMPGSIFGFDDLVSFVLLHESLLFYLIILFTLAEFLVGLGLMLGLLTRFFAFCSMLLSVSLMLIFGWLGATCLDEWTMSSCNFAIGAVLLITGGGMFSLDRWLDNKFAGLRQKSWYQACAGVTITPLRASRLGILLGFISIIFSISFYQYLHQGIIGPIKNRTDMVHHNVTVSNIALAADQQLIFTSTVDAGPDTQGAYIIEINLRNHHGELVQQWDGDTLAQLPPSQFENTYKYSTFKPSRYGIMGVTGAKSNIFLPFASRDLPAGPYILELVGIEGQIWEGKVNLIE